MKKDMENKYYLKFLIDEKLQSFNIISLVSLILLIIIILISLIHLGIVFEFKFKQPLIKLTLYLTNLNKITKEYIFI